MAANPSASPGPTHHENTSTDFEAGATAGPQAERIVAAMIRKATITYNFLFDILNSPY
jgi:hypothetical protein